MSSSSRIELAVSYTHLDVYKRQAAYRLIPEVMCFDIGPGTPRSGLGPAHTAIRAMPLDPQFRRVGSTHDDLPADHGHTLVALREENGMLYLHELLESSAADRMGMNLYETKVCLLYTSRCV